MPGTLQLRGGTLAGLPALAAREPGVTTDQFRSYVGSAGGNRLVGLLENVSAAADPTVNDDAGDGYSVGSRWANVSDGKIFLCTSSTVGAATWKEVHSSLDEHTVYDAGTNNLATAIVLGHETTGTPATGFGLSVQHKLKLGPTPEVLAGYDTTFWASVAGGIAQRDFAVRGSDGNTHIYVSASAQTAPQVGFLGASPSLRLVSPDAGTALVTFGLASGTPTFGAANLTGTAPASVLPVFVAAGGSNAKGVVPAPGATAFTNNPKLLGSQAAFVTHSGKIVGASFVATQQSTTSTAFTDLATTQHVTFTLDEAADVVAFAFASYVNTSAGNPIGVIAVDVDGTDQDVSSASSPFAGAIGPLAGVYAGNLASGAHTIKLQFRVASGGGASGTGFFSQRGIVIFLKG